VFVVALFALPTFAACVATAPCAPLIAASAACSASLTDFGSESPTCLPWCVPSAAVPVAPVRPAAASVSELVASSVALVLAPLALAFALAWSWACACNWAAIAAAAAEVVVLPELLVLCWVAPLLLVPVLCCVLPDDEAEAVPLLSVVLVALLLWLPVALLLSLLFELGSLGCAAACALAEAAVADAEGAGVGAGSGALGTGSLALDDASFCKSILCCKVCANGWAPEVSGALLVGELLEESNSELINDSGDMADPVYPVIPVNGRSRSARAPMLQRLGAETGARVKHPRRAS
jgi:hypothetical protein